MKIVINRCYGGFSLSDPGVEKYAEKAGLTLYKERHASVEWIYWIVPKEQRYHDRNMALSSQTLWHRTIPRDDAALVETVQELREAANGRCAELAVVEIPDGVDWEICEYDGNEHVAEKHRTWG
jgi:hypothetical protein